MLKVAKFGGSSMADAAHYTRIRGIIFSDPARRIIVVSAAGKRDSNDYKITDLLYLCHAHLKYGVPCDSIFETIRTRYLKIRDELQIDLPLEDDFDALFAEMKSGITEDRLVSRGEYFSAKLLAAFLGFDFIDSELWVKFKFDGTIDQEATYTALSRAAAGRSAVIPGFYGVMPDGHIKLMDRGGSDITGALAAAALDADVYENWTDVSGILMADPRIVKNARTISRITYSELRELSYIGAQVLHEATIFPVREKNIPLNIRNTNDPSNPGTIIQDAFEDDTPTEGSLITGIAGRKGFNIVTITKNGMSSEVGSLRRILEIFERFSISIAYAPSGVDCYSVVIENKQFEPCRYACLAELQKEIEPDHIHVSENIAIVAVVGRKMVFRTGSSGRIFAALGESGVNIRMISQGPEELNIIIGMKERDYETAVRTLYERFIH